MNTKNVQWLNWVWGRALLALALVLGAGPVRAEEIVVLRGASTRVPVAEGVRRIAVGNPAVVDVRAGEDGRSVVVTGVGSGSSELRIERQQGGELLLRVVVHSDTQAVLDQLKELLGDVEGLEIKALGEKVVLKGNVVTKSAYERVLRVAGAYGTVVLNATTFDFGAMNKLVEATILKEFQDMGVTTVQVRVEGDTAVLQGEVYSEAEMARTLQVAQLKVPQVRNLLRLQDVVIETDVEFVQVNVDKNSDYGRNLLEGLSGTANFGGTGPSTGLKQLVYTAQASASVHAVIGHNNSRMVARSNVSSKNGTEGSALVGGELGIKISGNVGGSLEKVPYGVSLKVKPVLQGRDNVQSSVTIELSTPTSITPDGYQMDKSKTETTVVCKVGESIVLSGLVQALGTRTKSRTPIIGDIPLLDLFFSNKSSDRNRKELVVVLTPRPVFPRAATGEAFGAERARLLENKEVREIAK